MEGILDIKRVVYLGLAWWDCEECGKANFEIYNDELHYRCKDCGYETEIPYA